MRRSDWQKSRSVRTMRKPLQTLSTDLIGKSAGPISVELVMEITVNPEVKMLEGVTFVIS